jgi:hypothetical protein
MLTRLRNLWRPANFHLHHRVGRAGECFEGWYFKVVDPAGAHPYAIIPGVFLGEDPHAFIQVLDGARGVAWYHRYPAEAFAASRRRFDVRIGQSRFHSDGFTLDADARTAGGAPRIRGEVRFGDLARWPVKLLSPGVMGPFGLLPFLECYHGILSVDHTLSGALEVDGAHETFDGGRGYLEKDWGRGFPEGYVWMQSNHFDRPGISVTASVAKVPLFGASFRGFLAGFYRDGALHRFTTYTGARVSRCAITDTHVHVRFEDLRYRLEVDSEKADGAMLKAPYERQMLERVAETMRSEVRVRFSRRGGKVLYEGVGRHGCLEAQGNLRAITI